MSFTIKCTFSSDALENHYLLSMFSINHRLPTQKKVPRDFFFMFLHNESFLSKHNKLCFMRWFIGEGGKQRNITFTFLFSVFFPKNVLQQFPYLLIVKEKTRIIDSTLWIPVHVSGQFSIHPTRLLAEIWWMRWVFTIH